MSKGLIGTLARSLHRYDTTRTLSLCNLKKYAFSLLHCIRGTWHVQHGMGVVHGEIGCSKWKKTLAYLLVVPGSRARIVRCGGRYDPQLVKRSSQ